MHRSIIMQLPSRLISVNRPSRQRKMTNQNKDLPFTTTKNNGDSAARESPAANKIIAKAHNIKVLTNILALVIKKVVKPRLNGFFYLIKENTCFQHLFCILISIQFNCVIRCVFHVLLLFFLNKIIKSYPGPCMRPISTIDFSKRSLGQVVSLTVFNCFIGLYDI